MDIEDIVAKVDYLQLRKFMKDDFNKIDYQQINGGTHQLYPR